MRASGAASISAPPIGTAATWDARSARSSCAISRVRRPTRRPRLKDARMQKSWRTAMFDLDQLIADCRTALAADRSHKFVREVLARTVSEPASVLDALGEPKRAGLHKLHQSADLTILNVIWAPMMTIVPHNHHMWAVIGIYTGREDNIFWRRIPSGRNDRLEAAGAKALCERDAELLGHDVIHSVTNP